MFLTLAFSMFVGVPLGMLVVSVGRTVATGGSAPIAGAAGSVAVAGRPVVPVGSAQRSGSAPAAATVAVASGPSPVPADLLAAAKAVNVGASRFVPPAAATAAPSGDVIAFRRRPVPPVEVPHSHTG